MPAFGNCDQLIWWTTYYRRNYFINELKLGTATNEFGYYQLDLLPGKYTLTFNSLESIERNVKINLLSSGQLNTKLDRNLYLLQEVEIKSSQNDNVRGTQMGFERISARMISSSLLSYFTIRTQPFFIM